MTRFCHNRAALVDMRGAVRARSRHRARHASPLTGPTPADSAPGSRNASRQGAGALADSAVLELVRRALLVADRYARDAADDDAEPPECDICGGQHYTLNCPQPDD